MRGRVTRREKILLWSAVAAILTFVPVVVNAELHGIGWIVKLVYGLVIGSAAVYFYRYDNPDPVSPYEDDSLTSESHPDIAGRPADQHALPDTRETRQMKP